LEFVSEFKPVVVEEVVVVCWFEPSGPVLPGCEVDIVVVERAWWTVFWWYLVTLMICEGVQRGGWK
jgi:hypothetical protein